MPERDEGQGGYLTAVLWLSGVATGCFVLVFVLRLLDPPQVMSAQTPGTGSSLLDDFLNESTIDPTRSTWALALTAGLALVASWCHWRRARTGGEVPLVAAAVTTACLIVVAVTMAFAANLFSIAGAVLAVVALFLSAVWSRPSPTITHRA